MPHQRAIISVVGNELIVRVGCRGHGPVAELASRIEYFEGYGYRHYSTRYQRELDKGAMYALTVVFLHNDRKYPAITKAQAEEAFRWVS